MDYIVIADNMGLITSTTVT